MREKFRANATKNRNKIKQTNEIQWSQEKSWCKLENEDKSTNFANRPSILKAIEMKQFNCSIICHIGIFMHS